MSKSKHNISAATECMTIVNSLLNKQNQMHLSQFEEMLEWEYTDDNDNNVSFTKKQVKGERGFTFTLCLDRYIINMDRYR